MTVKVEPNEVVVNPRKSPRRAATASVLGTMLEYYDFTIYGLASALVFAHVFFPSASPTVGLLSAFATFGVGFLMRPIGGIIFGHVGDKIGRRTALVTTLLMMGISTVIIGFIPSFDSIGYWAPALLVALRLVQGLAYGGEFGGAVLMSSEHGTEKRRIFFAALPNIGVSAGSMLGTATFLILTANVPNETLLDWAWRIPFWLGGILVIVGLVIRLGVDESPEFVKNVNQDIVPRLPMMECIRRFPAQIVLVAGTMFGLGAGAYMVITYSVSFSAAVGVESWIPLTAIMISNAMHLLLIPTFASLADRFGIMKVFATGTFAWSILMLFMFPILGTGATALIFVSYFVSYGVAYTIPQSNTPGLFAMSFDPDVRYSGMVGVQLGMSLAGFTPFVATLAYNWGGTTAVTVLSSAVVAICAICGTILIRKHPELWSKKIGATSHL